MHLLEGGVNLIYIRDFLGHSSVTTTEIYAKSNPEIKRKFLEEAALNIDSKIVKYSEEEKHSLLEWLKTTSKNYVEFKSWGEPSFNRLSPRPLHNIILFIR